MVYLTALPEGLTPKERVRIEHLTGWALLRLGLLQRGLCGPGTSVEDLISRARIGPHGKPHLPGCHFSISHSRGIAGCALEPVPVGLDVERERIFTPGMIGKICTEEEARLFNGSTQLTQLWTCKESHMKLTGRGFSQGIRETAFTSLGPEPVLSGSPRASFRSLGFRHGGEAYWLTRCTDGSADFALDRVDFNKLDIL